MFLLIELKRTGETVVARSGTESPMGLTKWTTSRKMPRLTGPKAHWAFTVVNKGARFPLAGYYTA